MAIGFVVDGPLVIPDGWFVVWCEGCGASYTFDDEVYRDWDYIQLALVEAQKEHVRKDHPLGTG